MDSYFPKTRRPIVGLSSSLKRPPPSITPPKAAKIPKTPTTPKDARLTRPIHPPPIKRKSQLDAHQERKRPISIRELFKTTHLQNKSSNNDDVTIRLKKPQTPIFTTSTPTSSPSTTITDGTIESESPRKIANGPLKGLSTSLLDLIRAKEAAAKATTPEQERVRELLGIAPEIVRIVPTVFTANKKEVLLYDKVIDKCFKGLKSNYTSATIIECLCLMDKVAPEWISTVTISKGRFMRINRDKYTIPQLLEAIRRYKKKY